MIAVWLVAAVLFVFCLTALRGAPYVPSHRQDVRHAFESLYKLKAHDVLVDAGSGDGLVLRAAAARGAQAIGYEINPILFLVSWVLSLHTPRVRVRLADFWLTPLPDNTTVVYVFTVTRDGKRVIDRVQTEANRLGRPLLVISYGDMLGTDTYERKSDTHYLYRIDPLQGREAQV